MPRRRQSSTVLNPLEPSPPILRGTGLSLVSSAGGRVLAPLAFVARLAIDLVFPPTCLACRKAVADHDALCAACWGGIRFIERPFCERLGVPFAIDLGAEGLLSPEAIANPPVYARARVVARFDDGPARQLVHRLKYGDRLELAQALGTWMSRAGEELLNAGDLLVPVPLHRGRLIASALQSVRPARARDLGPQRAAARSRRAAPGETDAAAGWPDSDATRLNVQGAFKVAPEHQGAVDGRAVVLVDDVVTSGATANAAARALLRAGARRVDLLAFARVVAGQV